MPSWQQIQRPENDLIYASDTEKPPVHFVTALISDHAYFNRRIFRMKLGNFSGEN